MMSVFEVKFLGRGGYGCVSSAQILGTVAVEHGLWATAVPRFGAERRGSPVHADVRLSSKNIRLKSAIQKGDMTVVLNQGAFSTEEIILCTKPRGYIVINSSHSGDYNSVKGQRTITYIEGTKQAQNLFNTSFANIIILGTVFSMLGLDNNDKIMRGIQRIISSLSPDQIKEMIQLGSKYSPKINNPVIGSFQGRA